MVFVYCWDNWKYIVELRVTDYFDNLGVVGENGLNDSFERIFRLFSI